MLKSGDEVSIRIGHARLAQKCLVAPAHSTFTIASPTNQNYATKCAITTRSKSAIVSTSHPNINNSILSRKPQYHTATNTNKNSYYTCHGNHSPIHHSSSWVGERNSVSKAAAAPNSIVVDPASSRGYKNVSVATTLTRRSVCTATTNCNYNNTTPALGASSIHAQNAPNLKQFFASACYCNSPDCCEVRMKPIEKRDF